MCVSIQEEKNGHHKQYAQGRIITKSKIECGGVNTPRWRGSVTRANISIHIANNKVTYE